MNPSPERSATGDPVVYAGEFADVEAADPPGVKVLNRWQVLPRQLAPVLKNASALVVLDPLSFPFEALTDEQWDVPVLTTLPPSLDFDALTTVFGPALFERLGPFDRIATPDPDLWDALRRRYSWACSQHVEVETGDPSRSTTKLLDALMDSGRPLRPAKTAHRAEFRALASRIDAFQKKHSQGTPNILEVGDGARHRASSFDLSRVRFSGVYEAEVDAARSDFPEQSFDQLDDSVTLPHDNATFDLSFCVNFFRSRPRSVKRSLASEMWRVTRPDGCVLFLEDVVAGEKQDVKDFPTSVTELADLVLEAAAEPVELNDVESILYPGEDMLRGALVSFSRCG